LVVAVAGFANVDFLGLQQQGAFGDDDVALQLGALVHAVQPALLLGREDHGLEPVGLLRPGGGKGERQGQR